jgi:DNA replication protein DnaC
MKRLPIDEFRRQLAQMRQDAPPEPAPADSCPTCGGHRFIRVPSDRVLSDAGVNRWRPCPKYRPCPDCRRSRAHGIPTKLLNVTLADVCALQGNRVALERARGFAASDRDLFLSGPVGTGKTMLAAAIANEFCAAGRDEGWFVTWPLTIHQLQPGSLTEDERRALEKRLFTVPLLVLDDLGAERDEASDFTRRIALLTYEARVNSGLRTIITSNLTLNGLASHQGDDRLASRIAGCADVVVITGTDQRVSRIRAV